MFQNEHRWNLIFFLAWHVIKSLLHKEESSLIFSAKKLICIGKKSVPQTVCLLSQVNKYTAELSFRSSCNTLPRRAQMTTEICTQLFTRRRIKRRDRWRSFSISLNFYQTLLESSPQMTFIYVRHHKEIIITRCVNIYSRRNTGLPLENNWDRFARIPSNSQSRSHYWLQQSRKYRCMVRSATLRYSTTQFVIVLLCCISLRHEIALYTITKNRFCHLRPPAWLRQTLHSTPRLCMGNIHFWHENCSLNSQWEFLKCFLSIIPIYKRH